MLQVYVYNPDPSGYREMMQYEEDSQRASDAAEEKKQEILEKLEDDELIDIAAEAFGELYGTEYSDEADKLINEIVKALVLGCHKDMTVRQLLSHLSLEAEKIVTDYILTHAN
ncbi:MULTISPECIES: hypothetical protein [Snodgrassella]|uniref:hypothetical protein n=1 Tax=Snodgrassella TaxID=1193515 RepID=UPI000997E325|nr:MULTISPECIES: hypothetical protein [Snodgrassella]MBI0133509.1 hypothetical protein [Snodgrassella sp. W8132]OOX79759.1 hypothetical protein BGH94_03680 [Snodgrassella alvi]ORF02171.1 hypothetical protein BGH95_05805 [Snodgrassella alvi]